MSTTSIVRRARRFALPAALALGISACGAQASTTTPAITSSSTVAESVTVPTVDPPTPQAPSQNSANSPSSNSGSSNNSQTNNNSQANSSSGSSNNSQTNSNSGSSNNSQTNNNPNNALASTSCTAAEAPPSPVPFTPVMVSGITADDPDKGLNIRTGPSPSDAIELTLPNGTGFAATGQCERDANGTIWWEVENGHWTGWAASKYLTVVAAGHTTTCPAGNYNPVAIVPNAVGSLTTEQVLADVDGNGSVDTIYLTYDGVVSLPNAWTGTTVGVQIQYADGGLSTILDITNSIADAGPLVGISQPPFPERVDPENTTRSVGVISSNYSFSAPGSGLAHFIGELNCDPTLLLTLPVTPSAANPERPILCDVGGRSQLWAQEGLDANFNYLVREHVYDNNSATYVPLGQTIAGNANNDPEPTVC